MKKSIAIILVLMIGITMLAGCGGEGDALKGTWTGKDDNETDSTIVFDGKGGLKFTAFFDNNTPGTYTITGNQVEIKVDGWDTARTYTFTIDGNKLTLTVPEDQYYVGFDLTKK